MMGLIVLISWVRQLLMSQLLLQTCSCKAKPGCDCKSTKLADARHVGLHNTIFCFHKLGVKISMVKLIYLATRLLRNSTMFASCMNSADQHLQLPLHLRTILWWFQTLNEVYKIVSHERTVEKQLILAKELKVVIVAAVYLRILCGLLSSVAVLHYHVNNVEETCLITGMSNDKNSFIDIVCFEYTKVVSDGERTTIIAKIDAARHSENEPPVLLTSNTEAMLFTIRLIAMWVYVIL